MEQKNKYGFIAPKIEKENYIFGDANVPQVVLQENSDWTDFLPEKEKQSINFETFNCVSFGTLSAIEAIIFRLYKEKVNYSDRFVGIMAGTKEGGNDPHTVAEAIRKYGLIPEKMLPFSDDLKNISEYYSFKGADKEKCLQAGQSWLAKYDFKHEYVFSPSEPIEEKIKKIILTLKFSILGVSVDAWNMDERGVYIKIGQENHWTLAYNQKQFTGVFDTYEPFLKQAEQNFSYVKRFYIKKKIKEEPTFYPVKETNWLIDLLKVFGLVFVALIKKIYGK